MKRIGIFCLLLALMFLGTQSFALGPSFGVKGGLNLANYTGSDTGAANDMKFGFIGGLFIEFPLISMLSLQSEALLSLKGTKVELLGITFRDHLLYIDVPVVIKASFPVPPSKIGVFGGGYFGYLILARGTWDGFSIDIKDVYEPIDYGIVFGGSIDFQQITVDGRYALGLAKIFGSGYDAINSVISIMVGYRIR